MSGFVGTRAAVETAGWLHPLPAGWQYARLKWTVRRIKSGVWGADSDGGDDDIACVRVADFDRERLCVNLDRPTLRRIPTAQRHGRTVRAGDLLIEKSGGSGTQLVGAVVRYSDERLAVCSNFVARLENAAEQNGRYLTYLHASLYFQRVNYRSIKQTTGIQNLDSQLYLDEVVAIPPLSVQRAIADFLERKTSAIDALIGNKERLRALLVEKRAALIHRVVTRGLDHSAPTRDSGLVWSGEIPAHWQVRRLKFLVDSIEQGWSPECEQRRAKPGEWGVLKVGCVNRGRFDESQHKALPASLSPRRRYEIRAGDLLMSRANTSELVGSVALVNTVRARLLLCDKLYRLRVNKSMNRAFLAHALNSPGVRSQHEAASSGASASMQNVSQDRVGHLWVVVPPVAEQAELAAALERELAHLSATRTALDQSIERLREYRWSLMTAAVTGQCDIADSGL